VKTRGTLTGLQHVLENESLDKPGLMTLGTFLACLSAIPALWTEKILSDDAITCIKGFFGMLSNTRLNMFIMMIKFF